MAGRELRDIWPEIALAATAALSLLSIPFAPSRPDEGFWLRLGTEISAGVLGFLLAAPMAWLYGLGTRKNKSTLAMGYFFLYLIGIAASCGGLYVALRMMFHSIIRRPDFGGALFFGMVGYAFLRRLRVLEEREGTGKKTAGKAGSR